MGESLPKWEVRFEGHEGQVERIRYRDPERPSTKRRTFRIGGNGLVRASKSADRGRHNTLERIV